MSTKDVRFQWRSPDEQRTFCSKQSSFKICANQSHAQHIWPRSEDHFILLSSRNRTMFNEPRAKRVIRLPLLHLIHRLPS